MKPVYALFKQFYEPDQAMPEQDLLLVTTNPRDIEDMLQHEGEEVEIVVRIITTNKRYQLFCEIFRGHPCFRDVNP